MLYSVRTRLSCLAGIALTVLISGSITVLQSQTNPRAPAAAGRPNTALRAGYGRVQLAFEPNYGQAHSQVKFLSHAPNHMLWLTAHEAVLALGTTSSGSFLQQGSEPAIIRFEYLGANRNPKVAGDTKQVATVNYFAGKPDQWRTKIPTYSRVRYRNLYRGVDLVFYGNNQRLEYDLVIAPGADPNQIRFGIAGAKRLWLDKAGNLVMATSRGDLIQHRPRIYQRTGMRLMPVEGEYSLAANGEVGFHLGNYDRRRELVIDPVLRYSTLLGGSGIDQGSGVAVDSRGRAVIAGQTCSPNFPAAGETTPPSSGCAAFVVKLNFSGTKLLFSDFIAGSNSNPGMALDNGDNIYLSATTGPSPTDFPVTPGAFQTDPQGGTDAYVVKLNSTGTRLVYATFLGGSDFETGFAVAVDREGNAYAAGATSSPDFPTTTGAFQTECELISQGRCDTAYVVKLNAFGTRLRYSSFLGGNGPGLALGIAVDGAGHAIVVGATGANNLPTTTMSAQPTAGGGGDAFVAEFSTSGTHLIYSTYLGGGDSERATAVAVDARGDAYVAGDTSSTDFPVKNAFQSQCNGPCIENAFVVRLNRFGQLVYSTYLGGTDGAALSGIGTGVAVLPNGLAFVAGFTQSARFPVTPSAIQQVFGGFNDIFLTAFSPHGELLFATYFGGSGSDQDPEVAVDRFGNAYLTGSADFLGTGTESNFPVTSGALQTHEGGGGDAFAAKIEFSTEYVPR